VISFASSAGVTPESPLMRTEQRETAETSEAIGNEISPAICRRRDLINEKSDYANAYTHNANVKRKILKRQVFPETSTASARFQLV